jgi:hypothetical protein
MRKKNTAALFCFIFSVISGGSPAFAGGIGGCFHGDCDAIWKLNQAFDSGLRSKSESIVGPFKQAYFDVANDLVNIKINPMISDIDSRIAGRLSQAEGILQEAQQAIDGTLDNKKERRGAKGLQCAELGAWAATTLKTGEAGDDV